ncbi:MAG TPA: PQQ-binding-like beta-propeller repeat protein [Candidatus Polarisedimenticolaceae bacterium]|nr:PQQ-binding-like beta-propeller repeat protein [Candidatus Polarisedimenticolaceae bacterium]
MTTKRLRVAGLAFAALLALPPRPVAAEGIDWPQFRGADRDGVSSETGLLQTWPDGGPNELWRVELGEGYSAVSIAGDRVYTMYAAEHEGKPVEVAAAFEAASGKLLWKTAVGPKKETEFGNGPRSTPTVDGQTVYVLGSEGSLAALNAADGKPNWQVELTTMFGGQVPFWGFSTSPLVDGELLILQAGGADGKSYVALDKKTGELKWAIGDGGAGYNSPLLVELGGARRYLCFGGGKLMALDGQGAEVWSVDWPRGETHAMPVFIPPDRIFASGAEGIGARLLRVGNDADGKVAVEELWSDRFMRNHFSSSVAIGATVYGFDNATLKAISLDDAKLSWAKRGLGKGSLIYADGNLLVLSDRGELLLVRASPDAFTQHGAVQALDGRTWTAPSLSRGRLYLRDQKQMVAYDLRQ